MPRRDPHAIERLIERILDAEPAEWPPLEVQEAGSASELDALQTLSDIARTFRRFESKPRDTAGPLLFRWGHLAVLEKVATGGSGEVYRAWDAGLGTHVALKLLRKDSTAPKARAFLDEARRLARIRHHNVLSVYGAGTFDARPGLWCEWIDGQSLAAQVIEQGAMGPEETIVLGMTLCRALGAVHAAGLLHGDVKPENVLRERGGRIVLADLGAGGEPDAVNASLRSEATPAWLAPEVLKGAMRTQQQDLFSLGGVLQYALTARVPDPARLGADLNRADLPMALHAVIERARARDPAARFGNAAEMENGLTGCLTAQLAPRNAHSGWRVLAVTLAAAALFAVALAWWAFSQRSAADVDVALMRQQGAIGEVVTDGMPVSVGDRLSFRVSSSRPVWLYAFAADDRGELQRLFPLAGLDTANPLPAGRDVEIPVLWQGRAMRFEVSSQAEAEDFLLVASLAAVDRLEKLADETSVTDARIRTRGTGLIVPATTGLPASRLDALATELAAADPSLRLWRFHLPHRERPASD